MSAIHPMHIAGLSVAKISQKVLRIYQGECYGPTGVSSVILKGHYDINMGTVGAGGLDVGLPRHLFDYFPYVLKRTSDGAFGAVLSHSKSYGGVIVPSGYTILRKLRFGFVYRTDWGGIPNFHVSHMPNPFVRLSDAQYRAPFSVLFGVASVGAWKPISLSGLIPDNARLAHLMAEVRYTSGSTGSGYLRTGGIQPIGLLIGSAGSTFPYTGQSYLTLATNSTRGIEYRTTGSVLMYIQVVGYDMTEPS